MSAILSPMFPPPGDAPATPARRRGAAPLVALVVGALVIFGLIWALRHLVADARPPARQVARIAILPDTPPPPPPKVEHREEPKEQARPQPQPQEPKPQAPPAPEPLKMEGPAGTGPSAFAAGPVTQDYQGGPTVGGAGGGSATDRAQERLYANSVRQLLHDELERQLGPEVGEVSAQLAIWVAADGRITRWEWTDAGAHENDLQAAMRRAAAALQLPAPATSPQAMRFRLTLRGAS
jgi:hypothetical protein